jgi:hypothetical protein
LLLLVRHVWSLLRLWFRTSSVWINMKTILSRLFCDTVYKLWLNGVWFHWMDNVLLLLTKKTTYGRTLLLRLIYFTVFSSMILWSGLRMLHDWLALIIVLAFNGCCGLWVYTSFITYELGVRKLSWFKRLTSLKLRRLRLAKRPPN